jgi:Ca2+-dependent lipid-binding protein
VVFPKPTRARRKNETSIDINAPLWQDSSSATTLHQTPINKGSKPRQVGLLTVKVVRAEIIRNTETMGEMDPFVKLEIRGKSYCTKVADEGGKRPVWNETMSIPIVAMDDEIKVSCIDEDLIINDHIGDTKVPVSRLCSQLQKSHWIPIFYKQAKSGEILLETSYDP